MTETERKEKMNELMNKISIALEDATLAQGFEIICKRIAELEKENDDLKSQIKSLENDFDYQNKVIDKHKENLKKLRVAYIQAQVANVISGTDFESILKNILNGEV